VAIGPALRAGALIAAAADALALDPDRPVSWAAHDDYGLREGLPTLGMTEVSASPDGYLWLATEVGLVRFDGLRFVTFDRATVPLLRSSQINGVLVAREGTVYAATLDGAYRLRSGSWEEIAPDSFRGRRVGGFAEGPDGRILVHHSSGAEWLVGSGLEALAIAEAPGIGEQVAVVTAEIDRRGTAWIVADNGKRLIEWGERRREHPLTAEGPLQVTSIALGPDGLLWAATDLSGILRHDGESFVPVATPRSPGSAPPFSVAIDPHGRAWVGYADGTMVRLGAEGHAEIVSSETGGTVGPGRAAVAFDREGSVWFPSRRGLERLRDASVLVPTAAEGWPDGQIVSVYPDTSGRVWAGLGDGSLRRWDGAHWSTVALPSEGPGGPVLGMGQDRSGTVWAGRARGGLYWFDDADRPHLAAAPRSRDVVFDIAPCPEEACVLVGMSSGAWRVTPESATPLPFARGDQAAAAVFAVLPDRAGRVWIGTSNSGVYVLERSGWTSLPLEDPLTGPVFGLHEDAEGAIWIATIEGGLIRVQGGAVDRFGRAEGLPGDSFYGVATVPGSDDLWILASEGFIRVPREALAARAGREREAIPVELFGASDGLRPGETMGGGTTFGAAKDGTLFAATPAGLARIDPAHLARNTVPPKVVIESLECDGQSIDLRGAIRLPPGTIRCDVRFAALGLRAPSRVTARYRIEGLDEAWVPAGQARTLQITKPAPGDYTLRVIAANEHGIWNTEGAALAFTVEPSLWQRRWFWALLAAVSLIVAWIAYRVRVARLVQRQEALERLVGTRTAELAEANRTLEARVEEGISRLRGAERMAAYGEMVAAVAHEVRHPILSIRSAAHLIGRRAAEGPEGMRLPLATLDQETGRMSRLMDDLLEFAKPGALVREMVSVPAVIDEAVTAARAGGGWEDLPVETGTSGPIPPIAADRGRLVQVFVNLLENARKHAHGLTRIRVRAHALEGRVILLVDDDGAGIPPDLAPKIFEPFVTRGAGTGLGLAIARRIVLDHGGRIDCSPAPGRGTRFTIMLPLDGTDPA
jgi:signal transduction histidine kinase/ligand-binding sensor domain-containing protein